MTKNKIYDLSIIILLYIGISCIPFSLIPIPSFLVTIFQIISQIIIFGLVLFILKKSPLKKSAEKKSSKEFIAFLPLFIICFSNFFCLLIPESNIAFSFSFPLLLEIVLSILIAWNEEYIFRLLLINNLDESKTTLYKILISSCIFALCHLTHFISTLNPVALIDVVYTFGVGLILGFIYVYSESLALVFVFHSFYNIINNNLAQNWISYGNNAFLYYLINIIVGLVAGIYLLVLYLLKLKKVE